MATLLSRASGNFTDAATWSLVESASYSDSETGTNTVGLVYALSNAFTPAAVEIDAIGIKLANRTIGDASDISVALDVGGSTVAGTEVTIDTQDLPAAIAGDLNGGWIIFKFAAPVTLAAVATTLKVRCSTPSAVTLRVTAGNNWSRLLRRTATKAPDVTDDMIVAGEKTGPGTSNAFTVTMNNTATTDFGSTPTAANSLLTPGLAICHQGTVSVGTAAATNYVLRLSNSVIVYAGGTLNFGTSGTPIPSGSSFTLTLDNSLNNVDYGLVVRNLGTWNSYGTKAFTASPSNHFTLLNADEAAGQSVIGAVGDTTGWQVDDEICIASTSRTAADQQMCKIKSIDSSTQFTLWVAADAKLMTNGSNAAALTVARSGTNDANGDTRAEIGNLTRNVVVQGESASLQGYVWVGGTAVVTLRYSEFRYLGSATANKRGFDIATTTGGTFNAQFCSFHNFRISGSRGLNFNSSGVSGSGFNASNNVFYFIISEHFVNLASAQSSFSWVFSNNLLMASGTANIPTVSIGDIGGTFDNNRVTSALQTGESILLNDNGSVIGSCAGNISHSNTSTGIAVSIAAGNINGLTVWRNGGNGVANAGLYSAGANGSPHGELTVTNLVAFGNNITNVVLRSGYVRLISPSIQAGVTLTTTEAIRIGVGGICEMVIENGNIGDVNSFTQGVECNGAVTQGTLRLTMYNTRLVATTLVTNVAMMSWNSYIASIRHGTTLGDHRVWKRQGRTGGLASLLPDTSLFRTASPSLAMWPGYSTFKLESSSWEACVASGGDLTASVYIRTTSLAGHSVLPRLMVHRNVAAGIAADTQIGIATVASNGAWELVTGSLSVAGITITDDAVLEFYVDCEGTSGSVNVDDFSCVGADPTGLKFWSGPHAGPLTFSSYGGGGSSQYNPFRPPVFGGGI